jgi:hypothetical protein
MQLDVERLKLPPESRSAPMASGNPAGRPAIWRRILLRLALAGSTRRG